MQRLYSWSRMEINKAEMQMQNIKLKLPGYVMFSITVIAFVHIWNGMDATYFISLQTPCAILKTA